MFTSDKYGKNNTTWYEYSCKRKAYLLWIETQRKYTKHVTDFFSFISNSQLGISIAYLLLGLTTKEIRQVQYMVDQQTARMSTITCLYTEQLAW